MIGALFGDIVGSVYEFYNTFDYNFPLLRRESRPTDDSYMTLAVCQALLDTYGKDDDTIKEAVIDRMHEFGARYPHGGYGGHFRQWLITGSREPYNSFGNGSGMRVSSVGWLYPTLSETMHVAKLTAEVTHNHPEGIKGAQAIAAAIFMARCHRSKDEIRDFIEKTFDYDLHRTLAEIKKDYGFHEICQKSVPEAIIAFLEGESFEDVIRKAVSLGGDSDTIACMAGGIAEAYFEMPAEFKKEVHDRL
ncbi:MAG: ADP-ribosylglycohydrolase family protein, partial [Erysipelotrichaceae bacterium]|nr:ADP-ribosylglycohydrolase family protein [Erysipelotrichaceae bacterium]